MAGDKYTESFYSFTFQNSPANTRKLFFTKRIGQNC